MSEVVKEKELTAPVLLCDLSGRLNDAAVGWSRRPLHACNLSGHWPRKKKWSYWCVTGPNFAFSVTLAHIDYMGLADVYFLDCDGRELIEKLVVTPLGAGIKFPETVEESIAFSNNKMKMAMEYSPGKIHIRFNAASVEGKKVSADIEIENPSGHETLNVVVPWNTDTFQFTSKQNTLPASGVVEIGGRKWECNPKNTFACLDYGRGVWPYRTRWNWASSSSWQGGDLVGIQLGGKWTDGTGSTENGVCLNGKLHKISDRVVFSYNTKNFMKPWDIRSENTDEVALTFTPFFEKKGGINLLVLRTNDHQMFGHFSGTLRTDKKELKIENAFGWAEEHISLW